MTTNDKKPVDFDFRRRAEIKLAQTPEKSSRAEGDKQRLNHELQVHQIELEMQNEALREAQAETSETLQKVEDLNLHLEELVLARTAELATARDAAEAANIAMSAFLANMSHEIRTPLSAIVGLAHLLRKQMTSPGDLRRVDQVIANSDHLLAIINDILDLSKIEAKRLTLDQADFRLDDVVTKSLRIVEDAANDKGLTLKIDVPRNVRDMALHGDPLRLTQVLINLCGDAVKFTDHGEVCLSITCLAEQADRSRFRFAVEDTGIGIASADQVRLFNPFEQARSASARLITGTGLGLAISQRLVGLMGGTIEVISRLGEGSTFSFELELTRAIESFDESKSSPTGTPSAAFNSAAVLVAEDHPLSQEILFEMLEDLGCEVDMASNGAEAVECARKRSYDLILLDMQMPKMDGITAAHAIRALPGHRRTTILALTANAFAEDRQRCLDAGMNGHIVKPVTPATLATILGHWLSGLYVPIDEGPVVENDLSRALAKISGFEVGANRSPDEWGKFGTLLVHFVALHGHDMVRLRKHLAAGENEAAQSFAHRLIGIAGLIGAQRVALLATQIELGLRTGQDMSWVGDLVALCEIELMRLQEATKTLPCKPWH